jgi:hypothetical protein
VLSLEVEGVDSLTIDLLLTLRRLDAAKGNRQQQTSYEPQAKKQNQRREIESSGTWENSTEWTEQRFRQSSQDTDNLVVLGKVNPRDHHRDEDHERIQIQELDKNHSSILVQPLLSDLC